MRHLLDVLCKDFKEPDKTSSCLTDLEKNSFLDALHSHLESEDEQDRTHERSDTFSPPSPVNRCDSLQYSSPLSASTPTRSSVRSASPARTIGQDEEDDKTEGSPGSPQLSDGPSSFAPGSEEGVQRSQTDGGEVSSENHELESAAGDRGAQEELCRGDFERSDNLEDLETKLYEMQLEAGKTGQSSPADIEEEHTASSVSDDDF